MSEVLADDGFEAFVRKSLESGVAADAGIPDSLRALAEGQSRSRHRRHCRRQFAGVSMLMAALAIGAVFSLRSSHDGRVDMIDAIELLAAADGRLLQSAEGSEIDKLLAWQDAPYFEVADDSACEEL